MGTVHRLIKFFEDGAQTDPTPAVHSSSGSMGGGAAAAATRPLAPINENREGVDNLAFKAPSGGADAGGSKESVSLDDFRLLAVIGRGGYGKVVQAEHLQTKQIYAIKIIKKSLQFEGDDDFDWVLTEKSVFKVASDYPFLVGLHSCFQTNSRLFFVMAFVPGGDLFHHMEQQKKLPEEHARFYSAEIILALDYLHSRGIIYRDLKPDNVLIDAEGHFKLTDYGMCKENMGPNDLTSSPFGTPNYMTPELLQSYDYSFSVDWWALGVLMFEMMAGRKPFEVVSVEGEDEVMETARLFASIRDNPIRLPRSLSVPARAVLGDFLNKDPSERLGCKKDIDEGLRDIMAHTFFRGHIDWEALEAKQVEPPYIPCLDGDRDLKHFDTQYTNEPVTLISVAVPPIEGGMKQLKTTLDAKFGKKINLESAEDE